MADSDSVRLLSLPPSVVESSSLEALADVHEYANSDGVWVPGPTREPGAAARARHVFDAPVVHPPLGGESGAVQRHDLDTVAVCSVQSSRGLPEAPPVLEAARSDAETSVLVCDDVTTSVRLTALETELECASALVASIPECTDDLTVLTGGLPASYGECWWLERSSGEPVLVGEPDEPLRTAEDAVAVRIHGLGPVEGYGEAQTIATLSIDADGSIDVETLEATTFGLRAVTGVGPETETRLTRNGITTRETLRETSLGTLCSIPGIGRPTAERMRAHATVLETGEPRRLTDDSLPGANRHHPPLCVDIETDGLSPSIIWQVGVYDPASDRHQSFVESSEPTNPERVLEAFCDWLFGVHPDRALLTWNGWRFDYRHLGAFVNRYLPQYADSWEAVSKFDLYLWAVTSENALLPGRTNKLEAVARALGYEDSGTGLDGAATAAAYQRFVRTGQELEWDRHEAYCEDDCRALWHVYERLRDAPLAESAARTAGQTGLGEF